MINTINVDLNDDEENDESQAPPGLAIDDHDKEMFGENKQINIFNPQPIQNNDFNPDFNPAEDSINNRESEFYNQLMLTRPSQMFKKDKFGSAVTFNENTEQQDDEEDNSKDDEFKRNRPSDVVNFEDKSDDAVIIDKSTENIETDYNIKAEMQAQPDEQIAQDLVSRQDPDINMIEKFEKNDDSSDDEKPLHDQIIGEYPDLETQRLIEQTKLLTQNIDFYEKQKDQQISQSDKVDQESHNMTKIPNNGMHNALYPDQQIENKVIENVPNMQNPTKVFTQNIDRSEGNLVYIRPK